MFSDDEEFLICYGCLAVPDIHIGLVLPNRASVTVGVFVVCVYDVCTKMNMNIV